MSSHNKLRKFSTPSRRFVVTMLIIFTIVFIIYNSFISDGYERIEIRSEQIDFMKKKTLSTKSLDQHNHLDENAIDVLEIPTLKLITEFKNGIYFYNIHEQIESWWSFDCFPTRIPHLINSIVCIHDPRFDKEISQRLRENGMWEPMIVRSFVTQLLELNDTDVIDIGANIGVYSLLAAKLGRNVIAVEPLYENLNRMHKAAHLEGIQDRIVALNNAVSNERTQLKLSIMDYNIGGTHVFEPDLADPEQKSSLTSSFVSVNSILLDDLVDVVESRLKTNRRSSKRKFILKLDIEGSEPYVFEKASRFFNTYEVPAVYIEFGKLVQKFKLNPNSAYARMVRKMLNFFKDRNFQPYKNDGKFKLNYDLWSSDEWPWDIYFKQCDLVFCPENKI